MNQFFGLLFYLKRSKMNAEGLIPVYLRITIDGERVEISSKRYVNPSHWNTNRQKLNGTGEDTKTINAYLKTLEHEIYEVHRTMIEKKLPLYEMSVNFNLAKQIIYSIFTQVNYIEAKTLYQ